MNKVVNWKMMYAIFLMEWRNILAYRVVFWTNFLGATLAMFCIGYFLWKSVFEYKGIDQIGGMDFQQMAFYYLLAPMAFKAVAGLQMRIMFLDIYEGSLNKYLLYPVNYFQFKLVNQFVHSSFYIIQMLLGMLIYDFFLGIPDSVNLTWQVWTMGLVAIYCGSYLFFMLECSLEQIAFWADNVWALSVLLRYVVYLFGGGLVPLILYPEWAQEVLVYTPFSSLLNLPINIFLGKIEFNEYLKALSILISWSIIFSFINKFVWHKGTKQYSGVGI